MQDPKPIWGSKAVLRLDCDPVVSNRCICCQEDIIPASYAVWVQLYKYCTRVVATDAFWV